jgi:lipopolysaccharide export system protein LptA
VPCFFHRSRRFGAGFLAGGLICASLAVAEAQNPPVDEEDPEEAEETGFLAGTLFPNNSILKDVALPSFGPDLNLTSMLTAEEMKIVTKKKIKGKNLKIEFFHPDESPQGQVTLKTADFNATKKLLTTREPVSFVSPDMDVDGTGLVFDVENNRGFLHGPVKAVSRKPISTSMNANPARRGLTIGALLMASVFPLPGQELSPEMSSQERAAALRPKQEELDRIAKEAVSSRAKVVAEQAAAENVLTAAKTGSEDARISMNGFFQAASLTTLLAEPEPAVVADVPRPPVSEKLGEETTITSQAGAFIDNNEGVIVFLKDVKVVNPEFTLTAQNEIKAFLKEKLAAKEGKEGAKVNPDEIAPPKDGAPAPTDVAAPEGAAAPDAPKAPAPKEVDPELLAKWKAAKDAKKASGGPGGSEDISRVIATGTVMIEYKPKDPTKTPAKASGHMVVYDFDKEQVLLKGGSPWAVIDGNVYSVSGNDAYILVYLKDGQPQYAVTRDGEMRAQIKIPEQNPKKKEAPKPKAR